MTDEPFAPPRTHVADTDAHAQPGSVWKGVLIGGTVDVVGTTVLGIIIFFAYMALNVSPEMSPADIDLLGERFSQEAVRLDSVWGFSGFIIGGGLSLLGGYICAGFARERWKLAALTLGVAMAAFGLVSVAEYYSLGENLSLALLTLAAVYLGGWLHEGQRTRAP